MATNLELFPATASVIAEYQDWVRDAREEHAETLEQANSFIVEHGFQQISDFVVDTIASFKAELVSKACERDPETDPEIIEQQIEAWARANISESGSEATLLAVIYEAGSRDLEFAIEDNTPDIDPAY
jgi:hypothetical protein